MVGYNLCFWEPVVSPHKTALFEALGRHPAVASVVHVADRALPSARLALGWTDGSSPSIRTIVAPTTGQVREMVRSAPADAVHVFSGLRRVPTIVTALVEAVRLKRRFGIMHEPRDWTGLAGLARRLQSLASEGAIRRQAEFILAIGRHGPTWFRMAGYDPARIFPFAYFLEFSAVSALRMEATEAATRVIGYLGRLTTAKGFGIFAKATQYVATPVQIYVAGMGDLEWQAHDLVEHFGVERARFYGAIPMSAVGEFHSALDILVVPSLTIDDGWAAVVGEALAAGTAVIASKHVGASVCLEDDRNGRILPSTDPAIVASVIDEICAGDTLGAEARASRKQWARDHLSAEAGAAYFVRILQFLEGRSARPSPFYESNGPPTSAT